MVTSCPGLDSAPRNSPDTTVPVHRALQHKGARPETTLCHGGDQSSKHHESVWSGGDLIYKMYKAKSWSFRILQTL